MRRKAILLLFTALATGIVISCGGSGGGGGNSTHTAYVTVPQSNHVLGFRINDDTGKLNSASGSPFAAGLSPAAICIHPSNRFAYVANQGEATVSLFTIGSDDALKEVMPRAGTGLNPTALTTDPAGNFLFVANQGTNDISVFAINSSDGTLAEVGGSRFKAGFGPSRLVVSAAGTYLYVANQNSLSISIFAIAPDGTLTEALPPVNLTAAPFTMTFDPSGQHLYVALPSANAFTGFAVDSGTGALTSITPIPFTAGTSPVDLALDSSGQFLYVANMGSNNIFVYAVDTGTGLPTQDTTETASAGTGPVFLSLTPSGSYLYVGNQGSKNISAFSRDATTGKLTVVSESPFTTTDAPSAMAITH